jgi:hypothetical protein
MLQCSTELNQAQALSMITSLSSRHVLSVTTHCLMH